MLLGEGQSSRKRLREPSPAVNDGNPLSKKRKTDSNNYSPQFWDTLSEVPLTRRALREFDRRTWTAAAIPMFTGTSRLLRSDTRRLLEFASNVDLSALQGFSRRSIELMSQPKSRKRDHSSSVSKSSGKTKTTTPYSGEFEQKLIDRGIYPKGYRVVDGLRPPKPNNMSEISDILGRPRPSLSPSTFSEAVFEDFQDNNERASSELKAMAHVIPAITGLRDCEFNSAADTAFHRLKKFDAELSVPKPDRYYGAKPAQIDGRVRRELDQYIIPSNRTSLPAAPSFFFEGKGASGRPDVAQRQAMYDSAVGARGILHLQNYGNATQIHDGNAYTMSATYHPGTGTLQMYATHPRESTTGETEYYMTQLGAYAMTNAPETFRTGAAAYRNAREWTQRQRDQFILDANAAALRTSTESVPIGRSGSHSTTSPDAAGMSFSSETSTDELALDHAVSAKRPRCSPRR